MKKLIIIFLTTSGTFLISAAAQGQTILCPDAALPYYMVNTDYQSGLPDYGWHDMYSPQTVEQGHNDDTYIEQWYGSPRTIQINYTTPNMSDHSSFNNCVQQSDLDACIANDFAQWTSICPGIFSVQKVNTIPSGTNGISIQWSTDPSDFSLGTDQNGYKGIAGGVTETPPGSLDPTTLALKSPQIFLNNSSNFNNQFVFTTCPQPCTIISPQVAVSICEVALHEIGHAFGLTDLYNDPSGMGYAPGVMWGEIYANQDRTPCPDNTLQPVDICYFCKLYCPDQCATLGASLPPNDTSMAISVFPNPATASFNVIYKTEEPYSSLIIEDIMGRRIERQALHTESGMVIVPRKNLPPGAYIVRLQGDQYFIEKLLIIQ